MPFPNFPKLLPNFNISHKKEEKAEAAPEEPPKPTTEELLSEILEKLKKK